MTKSLPVGAEVRGAIPARDITEAAVKEAASLGAEFFCEGEVHHGHSSKEVALAMDMGGCFCGATRFISMDEMRHRLIRRRNDEVRVA